MSLQWADPKGPGEVLDFIVDFSEWVATGRQIDSAVAVVESVTPDETPVQLSVDAVLEADDLVAIWFSGGTVGHTYTVRVTATDDESVPSERTVIRRVKLKVRER